MQSGLKDRFAARWHQYFPGADLPISFYYAQEPGTAERVNPPAGGHRCLMADIAKVRRGESLALDIHSIGCFGGKRYLGFDQGLMPNFEYFLSCGIPGAMEGERYKKTPELVRELVAKAPKFVAPAPFIVFKRWDHLTEADEPEVVIFFAPPDVLSGLFTLSGFDEADLNGVVAPFGAGCGTIVEYPYLERDSPRPRSILGMFDVSARPFVEPGVLSFAVPMAKFERMVGHMAESFLITPSWAKVRKRIEQLGG